MFVVRHTEAGQLTMASTNVRRSTCLLLVASIGALAIALTGCGADSRDSVASDRVQHATPTVAVDEENAAPTTDAQGGLGLPKAKNVTSLGIKGVTELTFPKTCTIQLVALDEAIGFTVGSAVVSPAGTANLATIASSKLVGAKSVSVVGYTSSEGNPAFNQTLSEKRAFAVRAVLGPLVPGATFSNEGRGPAELVHAPDGSEDRVASRRVVITAQMPEKTCSTFGS